MANNQVSGTACTPAAQATNSAAKPSAFSNRCRSELEYHRKMSAMWEWLLAQELLEIGEQFAEEFQAIIEAGLEKLAEGHRGTD